MKRLILGLVSIVVILVVGRLSWVLVTGTGMLEIYEPKLADQCRSLVVAPGTEDITADGLTGQVFVSADNRRSPKNQPSNGIYMFQIDSPERIQRVSTDAPIDFHPHGISLWRGNNGERRLFAVSHRSTGAEVIEVFDVFSDGQLSHVESITDDLITSPNDLVAVGPRQFYVTNDHGYSGFKRTLEDFLALPVSNVVWFDGNKGEVVINDLAYANGINMSPDGERLYVAEITRRRIGEYKRQSANRFQIMQYYPQRMAADNIEFDESGEIWTAGHPDVLAFLYHSKDAANVSASMASRINPISGVTTDVFYNDGTLYSGASVASHIKDTLLIGAVFADNILLCPAK